MSVSLSEENKIFIAGQDVAGEWEQNKVLQKLRSIVKNYLELDNVSFLFGAGSSINLGSISIASIPQSIELTIMEIPTPPEYDGLWEASDEFDKIIKKLQGKEAIEKLENGNINYPLEQLLNVLVAIDFLQQKSDMLVNYKYTKEVIAIIKEEIFKTCDLENLPNNERGLQPEEIENLKSNKFIFHEKFTKKILQRPLNLKRANVFTTNYDLAFDIAFDRLGVHYINGFSGFHKRIFRPETFDYDLFFPGSTTQGKVTRIEKVLRYYKLHGSLTWLQTTPSSESVYGIEEWPIKLVRERKEFANLMVYPSAAKKSYTLDFPYSELFRQFAATISQQQSVLVTFGYSFSDEHINDIIYQALTIPSFTLIVVDFKGTANPEIDKLNKLKDPRIIILEGPQLGSLPFFVEQVLPDFIEENIYGKVAETLGKLFDKKIVKDNEILRDEKDLKSSTILESEPLIGKTPIYVPDESPENTDDLPF